MVQRRDFLKHLAAGSAAALATPHLLGAPLKLGKQDKFGQILPTRPFGSTTDEVTIYCMGGSHIAKTDSEKEAQAIIEKAMDMGVRFYETAWTYAGGRAEELYGKYLVPNFRDEIFLATKNKALTASDARKQLDDSLRRLKTDKIDLYYLHGIETAEDVDERLAAGVLEVMLEAQQKGRVKYLGFSGHRHTSAHTHLIEKVAGKDPFVATQFPVNVLDPSTPDSFMKNLVPEFYKKGYAMMGMKSLAHGRFLANNKDGWNNPDPLVPNYLSMEEIIWFSLSQPITAYVSGTDKLHQVEQNVTAAWKFARLDRTRQEQIISKVSRFATRKGLQYFRPGLEG